MIDHSSRDRDKPESSGQQGAGAAPRDAAIGRFTNAIAHELNNILGIILGNAELASMDTSLSASARATIDEIVKAGRQGTRLVQQILAVGRGRSVPADASDGEIMRLLGDDASESPAQPATEARNAETSGKSILFLDDEEAMVSLVSRMLRQLGFDVKGFVQPEKALDAFAAAPTAFDLVVTDYNMPRLSGVEIARRVSALRPDVPVMVTSGNVTAEMRDAAAAAGVRHLVEKPSSMDELCAAIGRALAP